ncbi:MAG: SidJ-related pseudokinase [Deltaproteobacteria bacterium]|nr:SidJ-related pseudokinase [Deltaproteobacteria bacterium]
MEKQRIRLEKTLRRKDLDFSAAFMAVGHLHALIKSNPGVLKPQTVSVLNGFVQDAVHTSRKMSLFLYREAADALATVLLHTADAGIADRAFTALIHLVGTARGPSQRAAAESLGSLPLDIIAPEIYENPVEEIPDVKWQEVLKIVGISRRDKPKSVGRSLIVPFDDNGRVLAVKQGFTESSLHDLNREAAWMEHLGSNGYSFPVRFEIPMPVKLWDSAVFRLQNPPVRKPNSTHSIRPCYAIGFIVHKDYFTYPNDPNRQKRLGRKKFRQVLFRNSWLMGRLTAQGIFHSAPIPLFHNRMQRNRRTDDGLYEWQRGGRLDQWLNSCRYPNFGLSGIRDFEHLSTFTGSGQKLYRHIGTHLLSLLLVAGSYFRNKDAESCGLDPCGRPVDVRGFFDKSLFMDLIRGIFLTYYHGFAGKAFHGEIPFNLEELAGRMIEEMGVDHHMEEILRIVDQKRMTDKVFSAFLLQAGCDREKAKQVTKGERDIRLLTGPHLGGFNERISLPELIRFLSTASALCVAGRYWKERRGV